MCVCMYVCVCVCVCVCDNQMVFHQHVFPFNLNIYLIFT